MTVEVRRVRADEWDRVRELRLTALLDPDAAIAFLETHSHSAEQPDDFWRRRTARSAEGVRSVQFVAVDGDEWIGTASVISHDAGMEDHLGRIAPTRRADVVGVYVRPSHRGDGTIDRLLEAAVEWASEAGFQDLSLDVHVDNLRAQGAYRRAGFEPTGATITGPIGEEIVMARGLGRG